MKGKLGILILAILALSALILSACAPATVEPTPSYPQYNETHTSTVEILDRYEIPITAEGYSYHVGVTVFYDTQRDVTCFAMIESYKDALSTNCFEGKRDASAR